MSNEAESHPPRWINRVMRRMRRILLYGFLAAAATLVYLHHVGLPGWVANALVDQLRARGLSLDYGRIALRWYAGIVAEDVSLGRVGEPEGLQLHLPEVAFRLDTSALLKPRLVVRSLEVRNGRLLVPLVSTNEADQHVSLDRLTAELRFTADDTWLLENASAECLGIQLRLHAVIAHASALRNWRPPTGPDQQPLAWEIPLRRFVRQIKRLQFRRSPTFSLDLRGDARRPEAMRAIVRFQAQQAQTPWGTSDTVLAALHLNEQAAVDGEGRFRFWLETRDVQTRGRWGLARLRLETDWTQSTTNPVPKDVSMDLTVDALRTPWGDTGFHLVGTGRHLDHNPQVVEVRLQLAGDAIEGMLANSETTDFQLHFQQDLESLLPHRGDWRLSVGAPEFAWGRADKLEVTGRFERNDPATTISSDPSPGSPVPLPSSWQMLAPWQVEVIAGAQDLAISNAVIDQVRLKASWDSPSLRFREIEASLYGRRLQAEADLNLENRRLSSALSFDFDVRRVESLLPVGARDWLARYGWRPESPPVVGAKAWLTLPPLSELARPDTATAVAESLGLQGKLVAADGSFEGIPIETVSFDFSFTNEVWRLTDFVATAPEGRFGMAYTENQRTSEYRFDIDAEIDPRAFRSLVPYPEQQAFDFFDFSMPPRGQGFVTGRYGSPETTGFGGMIQTGPFLFRGEPIQGLEARLDFTNGWVRATQVHLRSQGIVQAKEVAFDTARQRLFLTEARSTVPPMRVARAIGDEVVQTLSPYRFEPPPEVSAQGWLNVQDTREANLQFNVAGGPFHYWRFDLPQIQGRIFWTNQAVRLREVEARFYGGRLWGDLDVDLTAQNGADLRFETRLDNVDVTPLMADLLSPTNRLEGRLHGIWTLTHANSEDWDSWNGLGRVELRDGYLWDIPLFGIGTTLMDNLRIEAGRSRVEGLTADFTMTNSLIHTRNLRLQSPAVSLDYRGTFDFMGGVDARMEARLFHEATFLGPVVSFLFMPLTKILEYKVTGTIADPELEPLYIPKPLLIPLNPIGALKDLFRRRPEPEPQE